MQGRDAKTENVGRRDYDAPQVRILEIDVMQSFPQNCKMEIGMGGFGGSDGPCIESGRPRVWCMHSGS